MKIKLFFYVSCLHIFLMDMWDLAKKINSCKRNDYPLRLIFKVCRVFSVVKELDAFLVPVLTW